MQRIESMSSHGYQLCRSREETQAIAVDNSLRAVGISRLIDWSVVSGQSGSNADDR
jgi:hypothetical protein